MKTELPTSPSMHGGGGMTPNRPPSCDLPPEFYDVLKDVKPCPMCENNQIGFDILTGIFIEEYRDDEVAVKCDRCGFEYNDLKHRKSKGAAVRAWNSLPRRSEVLELLRLVDEVVSWDEAIIDTHNFPEDGLAMAHDFKKLQAYAAKLRQEMEL